VVVLVSFFITSQAAPYSSNWVLDNLQEVLDHSDNEGLRTRRSTSTLWDKELHFKDLGVSIQIKYRNISNIAEGGTARVFVLPAKKLIKEIPIDDLELQVDFIGKDAVNGQFEIKITYKFIQKIKYHKDVPQHGSLEVSHKFIGSQWKSKVSLQHASNNRQLQNILDVAFASDWETKVQTSIEFMTGNKWDFKAIQQAGEKFYLEMTAGSQNYAIAGKLDSDKKTLSLRGISGDQTFFLDLEPNPGENWGLKATGSLGAPIHAMLTMQPDFKMVQLEIKFNNQMVALIELKGEAEMGGRIPRLLDYTFKYSVGSNVVEADIKYDGKLAAKQLEVRYRSNTGVEVVITKTIDTSAGVKYTSSLTLNSETVEKSLFRYILVNDASKFDLNSKWTFEQTQANPFFEFNNNCFKILGYEWEVSTIERISLVFYDKLQMDEILSNAITTARINKMKLEDKTICNNKTLFHVKYDNTQPKTTYMLSFLPSKVGALGWVYEGSRWITNKTFSLDHKIIHGGAMVQQGSNVFEVKFDDPQFDMVVKYEQHITTSLDSPLYGMIRRSTGRDGENIRRKASLFLNRNFRLKFVSELNVDGVKTTKTDFGNFEGTRWDDKVAMKYSWYPITTRTEDSVEVRLERAPRSDPAPVFRVGPSTSAVVLAMEYRVAEVPAITYQNNMTWSSLNGLEFTSEERMTQNQESPSFNWGKFWAAERTSKLSWPGLDMQAFSLYGKTTLDGELSHLVNIDTTSSPGRLEWHQPLSIPGWNFFGPDKIDMKVYNTMGDRGTLSRLVYKGSDILTMTRNADSNKLTVSLDMPNTMEKKLVSLALSSKGRSIESQRWPSNPFVWPRLHPLGNDIELDVIVGADNNMNMKLGWAPQGAALKKVEIFFKVRGNYPLGRRFSISRRGKVERTSSTDLEVVWEGEDEGSFWTPIETKVVVAGGKRPGGGSWIIHNAEAWKKIYGETWGLNINNNKLQLLTGV